MKKILFCSFIFLGTIPAVAQRILTDNIMPHISYLSSDELQGRATSTRDELKAAKYIAEKFKAMGLEPKGTKAYYADYLYKYNGNIHDTSTALLPFKKGRNVVAFIDNQADYTIVIGAHYDHLGLGYDHNSLDANPEGIIHNGADDNASGVAGVIELARYFSLNGIKENYNFLFITFSGEELGLLGSKKWCENPTYPLNKINYMINLDMIGRLNDSTKKLLIYGIGTSSEWTTAIEKANHYFSVKYDSAGVGPSDQTSFYLMGIPVLHFFTGQHSDYHKPTDDAYKVNIAGESKVLELIVDIIQDLDAKPKLTYYKTASTESSKMSFKVTLGIMPDYAFDGVGIRIDDVTLNKPAALAGIQRGDIIIQLGNTEVKNMQDYMAALNNYNKGDTALVTIIRKGEKKQMTVSFLK